MRQDWLLFLLLITLNYMKSSGHKVHLRNWLCICILSFVILNKQWPSRLTFFLDFLPSELVSPDYWEDRIEAMLGDQLQGLLHMEWMETRGRSLNVTNYSDLCRDKSQKNPTAALLVPLCSKNRNKTTTVSTCGSVNMCYCVILTIVMIQLQYSSLIVMFTL